MRPPPAAGPSGAGLLRARRQLPSGTWVLGQRSSGTPGTADAGPAGRPRAGCHWQARSGSAPAPCAVLQANGILRFSRTSLASISAALRERKRERRAVSAARPSTPTRLSPARPLSMWSTTPVRCPEWRCHRGYCPWFFRSVVNGASRAVAQRMRDRGDRPVRRASQAQNAILRGGWPLSSREDRR